MLRKRVDYTYINARLHGLISKLLTQEQLQAMDKAGTISELLHLLRKTPYHQLADVYTQTGDTHMVELELIRHQKEVFNNLLKHSPEELAPIVKAFSLEVDFSLLISSLRLWFDQAVRGRSIGNFISYIPREFSYNGVSLHQIINSRTIEELTEGLRSAGFIGKGDHTVPSLEKELVQVPETKQLFYVELAVDAAYYINLRASSLTLPSGDQEILTQLITEEIDMKNIGRIIRHPEQIGELMELPGGRDGHKQNEHELERLLIPGGRKTGIDRITMAVSASDSGEKRSGKRGSDARKDAADLLRALDIFTFEADESTAPESPQRSLLKELESMQHRLTRHLEQQVLRWKQRDPFTIGTLAAYLLLKKRDIENVRSLMHATYYGLPWKEVSPS
jgi:vacuolar-type H+-ATPase subunit C/Vma6